MKRMTRLAITLCAVIFATAGAGVGVGQQLPPPYRVVQFDVTHQGEVVGKLSVNTNAWTYVLNAHGLEPGTVYYFYSLGTFPYISSEAADENGDLHVQGTWDQPSIDVTSAPTSESSPTFVLVPTPIVGGYQFPTDVWGEHSCTTGLPLFIVKVWGTLVKNGDGTPLPGQEVTVWGYDKKIGEYSINFGTVITDSDGGFMVARAFYTSEREHPFKVTYAGNDTYAPTYELVDFDQSGNCPVTATPF